LEPWVQNLSKKLPVILEVDGVVITASRDPAKSGGGRKDPGPVMDTVSQPQFFHPFNAKKVSQTQVERKIQVV